MKDYLIGVLSLQIGGEAGKLLCLSVGSSDLNFAGYDLGPNRFYLVHDIRTEFRILCGEPNTAGPGIEHYHTALEGSVFNSLKTYLGGGLNPL